MPVKDKNPLGQYFTPYSIADLMVKMLQTPREGAILEPSSGEGIFLEALINNGYKNLRGVEIDTSLPPFKKAVVDNASFITWATTEKFDAVIGNPPYVRWKDLDERNRRDVQTHDLWGTLFNSLTDFLTVFIAKSVQHLKPGGELIFITPRFWMHTKNSEPLRTWLLKQGSFTDVIDYGEAEVFNKVSSSIIIFRYVKERQNKTLNLHRYIGPQRVPADSNLSNKELYQPVVINAFNAQQHWTLATATEQESLTRLENACMKDNELQRLGSYVNIANGLVSGKDAAFQIPEALLPQLNRHEHAAIKEVLKAKNFTGLVSHKTTPYIYMPDSVTDEAEFKANYPTFYAILKPLKEDLLRRHSYTPNLPYWAWAFKRSERFHTNNQPKIFVPCKERLTNRSSIRFTLPAITVLPTQDVTSFTPKPTTHESVEYIAAFLNLPEIAEWVKLKSLMKGGVAEFSKTPLTQLPFRGINWDDPKEVNIHNRIVDAVKNGKSNADVHAIVYELFSL